MLLRYFFVPLLALVLLAATFAAQAQNVGIGTTTPTQTLDVNGALRVRGLSGSGTRLPTAQPDGTLGVSDPYNATVTAPLAFPTAATGSVGTSYDPSSVAVSGTTAYVVNTVLNTLQVFDVSNPASPALLGSVGTNNGPVSVAVSGTTACVVNLNSNTLQVFNVSNPASPALLGSVGTGNRPSSVAVSGMTAYVVNNGSNTLQVFDVSSPASPVLRGSVGTGNGPQGVAVSGMTAYVVSRSNTLQVFNVSSPASPVLLGSVGTGSDPRGVAVSGTTACVVNNGSNTLQVFDVGTPASPALRGSVGTDNGPQSVAMNGRAAYVVNYNVNTLQVFDVGTPTSPVLLGSVGTNSGPFRVAVSGAMVYVLNNDSGTLQVFSVALPPRAVAVNPDGTLGSVALPSGADFIRNTTSQQTASFNINGTGTVGGRLGVGTSSPSQQLEVAGQIFSSTGGFRFPDNTVQTTAAVVPNAILNQTSPQANANFNIAGNGSVGGNTSVGGNSYVGGSVGIGTTAPLTRLSISQVTAANGTPGQNLGELSFVGFNRPSPSASIQVLSKDFDDTGHLLFKTSPGGSGATERVRLTADGLLGIGTTTPSQLLDVNGGILARANGPISNQGAYLQWNRSGNQGETWLLNQQGGGGGGIRFGSATTANVVTEWARFDGSGRLGVGTSSPSQQLEVAGQVFSTTGGFRFPDNTVQTTAAVIPNAILNQTSPQANANFNIAGNGTIAGNTSVGGNSYMGGSVGIGTSSPSQKLEVAGQVFSSTGGFRFPDNTVQTTAGLPSGSAVLNQTSPQANANFNIAGNGSVGGLLTAGSATVGGNAVVAGTLGIGTSAVAPATQKLDVRGNLRLGDDGGSSATGTGQAIEWVGPGVNTDPVGLYRVNPASDQSELRVVVGNAADANDKFVVGRTSASSEGGIPGGTFTPTFTVRGDGSVGIGTSSPSQKLDVNGSANVSGSSYVGGSIGIGTSSPSQELDVRGNAIVSGNSYVGSSAIVSGNSYVGGSANVSGNSYVDGNVGIGTNIPIQKLDVRGNANVSGNSYVGGNVGIGTNIPIQKLDVRGNVNVSGNSYVDGIANVGGSLAFRNSTSEKYNFSLTSGGLNLSESNVAANRLFVQDGGNVGIGTSNPIAKLHVSGSASATPSGGNTSYFSGGSVLIGPQPPGGTTARPTAAYFDGGQVWVNNTIVAGALNTTSDWRIKRVIGLSDRAADLALLNRLRITDYSYIDQHANTPGVIKKVIAQEVEQVLPTAVTRSTQALPNVYEKATQVRYAQGQVTVTTAKSHELPAGGGRLRFYTPANESLDVEVTVVDAHTVRFASAEAHAGGLFVYGKYVDDFRSVDYDALTTLNVSATQELARKVEALERQNAALEAKADAADTKATQATAALETFEARLRRLEAGSAQAQR